LVRTPPGVSPLEASAGFALGWERGGRIRYGEPRSPLAALELAVEPHVLRGPCMVAFSGGRDSSLVLAAAVRAAARLGAEPPVPVSVRYPGRPETDEREWQELVVHHLGVDDWLRIEVGDDLDVVGPLAQRALAAEGPLFPANSYTTLPLLEPAAGGSLLFGLGGDELLGRLRWAHLYDLLARRRRPDRRDPGRLAATVLPGALRARIAPATGSVAGELAWLRPAAQAELRRREQRDAAEPVLWARAVRRAAHHRGLVLSAGLLRRLCERESVTAGIPLLDPLFVGALARAGGPTGFGSRTAAMSAIAGDALPRALIERRTKAGFNRAFFASYSRTFAENWSGGGVDESLVDPEALRAEWLRPVPDFRTAMLLQAAWLDQRRADAGERPLAGNAC
jgi:asparagine synthetase B (glutamine-hydrolysing)